MIFFKKSEPCFSHLQLLLSPRDKKLVRDFHGCMQNAEGNFQS
jgi:hypothetical protein